MTTLPTLAATPVSTRPGPLTALRRHAALAALLCLLGLLAGVAAGASRPVAYTAEARLVVGQLDVSSNAIPGFALATQQLAVTYSRLLASDQVRADVAKELGSRQGLQGFTASPVPESAIVRVEATAASGKLAQDAADAAAAALVGQVQRLLTSNPGQRILQDYTKARTRVAAANAALGAARRAAERAEEDEAAQAAAAVQRAQAALETVQLEADALSDRYRQASFSIPGAPLRSVARAAVTGDTRSSTVQLYGLAGLSLGALSALLLTSWLAARRHRRTSRTS